MPAGRRFVIVFVVDGLRPDAVTPDGMPSLHRLRSEGVDFTNGHAVFPTVTRVNAAALATGMQPASNGILGNQIYAAEVDPTRALNTGDYRRLLELDEATGRRLVLTATLGERLHARGLRLAAVSSGSTGSALLTNPRARDGIGVLVNGAFDPGEIVGWPASASEAILARFGPAPPRGAAERFDAVVAWTQRVLREYVIPELVPDVVINWLTEPDHSQHHLGVGSPSSREALANDDREIARVLATLDDLGLTPSTDVLVVSDHGFTSNTGGVDRLGRRRPGQQRAGGRGSRRGPRSDTHRGDRTTRPGERVGRRGLHRGPRGQRQREHEPVERAQHVPGRGRELQEAGDDPRARGQRGRDAHDPRALGHRRAR